MASARRSVTVISLAQFPSGDTCFTFLGKGSLQNSTSQKGFAFFPWLLGILDLRGAPDRKVCHVILVSGLLSADVQIHAGGPKENGDVCMVV